MIYNLNYLEKEIKIVTKGVSNRLFIINGNNNVEDYLSDNYNVLTIKNIEWNKELAPWDMNEGKMFQFSGGADSYLKVLDKIISYVTIFLKEQKIDIKFYTICGYSLAGLFATYAIFKSNIFTSLVSCSSSFWYSGFVDYVNSHKISTNIKSIYFSLGDQEGKTRTKFFKDIDLCTSMVYNSIGSNISLKKFELNSGNHFVDCDKRLAKGIKYILSN